ncbi:Cytochrome c oxidase copper chaperone [Cichlidogyrus casuarinus]|uniref:Cytochrome c oxidase copper chaperone n=1 Tax=Cichlidogyrus casuarinus TaxID=1844966 RepID=A0ABD2Q7Q5_9PLAT
MLDKLVGREICLLGSLVSASPDHMKLKLKTPDDQIVDVTLPTPIDVSEPSLFAFFLSISIGYIIDQYPLILAALMRERSSAQGRVIEVVGKPRTNPSMYLEGTGQPIVFSDDASKSFDMEMYSEAVKMTATYEECYFQSNPSKC